MFQESSCILQVTHQRLDIEMRWGSPCFLAGLLRGIQVVVVFFHAVFFDQTVGTKTGTTAVAYVATIQGESN